MDDVRREMFSGDGRLRAAMMGLGSPVSRRSALNTGGARIPIAMGEIASRDAAQLMTVSTGDIRPRAILSTVNSKKG